MKKTNPQGDNAIGRLSGDTHTEARVSEESSLPPGSRVEDPGVGAAKQPSVPTWTARLKRRWASMLAWLAKGADHTCPT